MVPSQISTTQVLLYSSLTLGLVVLTKYLMKSKVPVNIPPFPVCARAYPILGHLPYLKNGVREQLKKWAEKTGDMISLYFGPNLVVLLNSYDAAYEAFVKHGDTLSDRPKSLSLVTVDANLGIMTSSGHPWKEQRGISLQILRSFGMGKNILALKVNEEVAAYVEALTQLSGKPINVRSLTNTAVANVICSIIVGKRFEYDDAFFVKFLHLMNEQVKNATSSSVFTIFPWLRHLPGDLFKAKERINTFNYIMAYFCDHYIEKSEKEYNENCLDNFIAVYLFEMKKVERHEKETTLNKQNLRRGLFHLFTAGTETTSTTMMWFLLYMLHFPDVQAKIFKEIAENVGPERAITMEDRINLNYANAAIMESQRLSSVGPLGLPHCAREDTVVKGYTIPAGTTVMINFDAVLLNDETWKNPMEFRPERFLDAQGKITQPEQFLPFSIGKRACLGESLARTELFLFLTSLVQRFELQSAVPGQVPTREYVPGLVCPPTPFQMRFIDRLEK